MKIKHMLMLVALVALTGCGEPPAAPLMCIDGKPQWRYCVKCNVAEERVAN